MCHQDGPSCLLLWTRYVRCVYLWVFFFFFPLTYRSRWMRGEIEVFFFFLPCLALPWPLFSCLFLLGRSSTWRGVKFVGKFGKATDLGEEELPCEEFFLSNLLIRQCIVIIHVWEELFGTIDGSFFFISECAKRKKRDSQTDRPKERKKEREKERGDPVEAIEMTHLHLLKL
ncbi:hypothetical protein V8C37DRAFT_11938 [Trichoderma ceciliae]